MKTPKRHKNSKEHKNSKNREMGGVKTAHFSVFMESKNA